MNIKRGMFTKEYLWRTIVTLCGLFVIVLTLGIGGFLVYKGSGTFLKFNHSIGEFLFSPDWAPIDNMEGGGSVGTLIFIVGSLSTCGLALLIATPFALGSAINISVPTEPPPSILSIGAQSGENRNSPIE
jgi:phosphate transport system permease protein